MDTSRNICIVLDESDLSSENIRTTVKTIEHNPNRFYLLATGTKKKLWVMVEDLSKSVEDDNTLTKMRIAYDLNFDLQTVLKTGNDNSADGSAVKTFADLLERLDFDENLNLNRTDYHVIINDDNLGDNITLANQAVAKLFQQTVFLNIVGLDIQKKSEIKKALIKDRFRANYSTLLKEVQSNTEYINDTLNQNSNLSTESVERASKIINAFNVMLAEFEKAKSRPIRIAAMGTKKAGKSVVINSLLKRDYAPTSSTLPTPNTIKYIPADPKKPLTLEYAGKNYTFTKAQELSNFIGEEFKRAQKITGEGAGLPNMTIYYPCDELTGYEVWDTPGPNVAFTDEHQKNAEECIDAVDVCIFVMNYSNHLTNDEVNFLKKIHKIFQEKNKFYSLFITVNRIDERYAVNEQKSVDRILDYICTRLEALDPPYKNVVIFGTSALQSFYLDSVIDLIKSDRREDGEDENELPLLDSDSIRPLKRHHKADLTPIKFIGDALTNLEDFHGIENPTEKELYALSGVPQLWAYTQYIGGSKADIEIVDRVVSRCEAEFGIVKNSLIITDLLHLTDKDKAYLRELVKLIEGLRREVDKAIDAVRPLMNEDKLGTAFYKVTREVRDIKKQAQMDAVDRCRAALDKIGLTADDVKYMATHQGEQSQKVVEFSNQVAAIVQAANKRSVVALDASKKIIGESQITTVERGIQGAQEIISRKTDEVKATVTNSTAKNILANFKKPEFPSTIDRLSAEVQRFSVVMDEDRFGKAAANSHRVEYETKTKTEYREESRTKYRTETRTRERESRGIWEGIRSFFGKTYYEDYQVSVPYTETFKKPFEVSYKVKHDIYDVDRFKADITREYQYRIFSAIDDAHDKMEEAIKAEIKNIFVSVKSQCDEIGNSYRQLYADFERDIEMASNDTDKHRAALERDIETFNAIKTKLQTFFDMWDEIIHGDAKG